MDDQGRHAQSPLAIPAAGWWAVLKRTWGESNKDNVSLVAAGVAFYGFLSLVPVIAATVLVYGLAADPATVANNVKSLTTVMPKEAAGIIGDQLMSAVTTSGGKKGFGLIVALGLALFSARSGATSVITALNIAYEEEEKRGFIKLNLLALAITAAAVLMAVLAAVSIASMAELEKLLPGGNIVFVWIGRIVSYVVLAGAGAAAVATLYRFGPSRDHAKWTWLTPGSLFSSITWIVLTLGFGFYVSNFGNYNATYGSLGAIVVLLTWLYLSSYVLLFGAELNAELEHQTEADTTTGPERPLGQRGAVVADDVAPDGSTPQPGKSGLAGDSGKSTASGAKAKARADEPSFLGEFAKARAGAHIARAAGLGKVGNVTTLLATLGLARLRKRGSTGQGAAILAAAAALAWWRRRK